MNTDPPARLSDAEKAALPVPDSGSANPAALQDRLASLQGQHLRLAADFDNFRKRTRRDAEQQAASEKEAFVSELLPVLDNLELALAAEPTHQGVALALRQLGQLLERHGIKAVEDMGRAFDPHRHEAIFVRADPAQPDHVVLEVTQRGYCRGDEVFRPAKVVVNDLGRIRGAGDAH